MRLGRTGRTMPKPIESISSANRTMGTARWWYRIAPSPAHPAMAQIGVVVVDLRGVAHPAARAPAPHRLGHSALLRSKTTSRAGRGQPALTAARGRHILRRVSG